MARSRSKIPISEWVAAVAGMIITAAALGFLFYDAFSRQKEHVLIETKVESTGRNASGYFARIKIANGGTATAENLVIEAELRKQGVALETSRIGLDSLPAGSERKATVFFSVDPSDAELRVRAIGYQDP